MNEIKELYKQLKGKVSGLDNYVTFGVLKFIAPGYLGSPKQKKDTEMLHGFVEFMQALLDEFDSEPTTQGLIEMKEKVIQNLTPLITKIETHPNWGEVIERDISKMQRVKNVRLFYSTRLLKEGNGVSLSLNNQIRYLYNFLVAVSNDLQEPIKEPDLPPIDATLKSAANYVVLLHDLGILEHLKTNYPLLPAQRLGELCQMITGKKTDYFREAIGSANPEKTRAFTDAGRREIESKLALFGIEKQAKKGKH